MEMSFIDLFEAQVLKTPHNIAVVFENQKYSYNDLNTRANRVAWYLRSIEITEESTVALYIERGIEMLVGMLGIMKTGAAYVPVDLDFPPERIHYILGDLGSSVILTSNEAYTNLQNSRDLHWLIIEEIESKADIESKVNLGTKVLPGHLAYIIYTSGSTGMPKGVMIEHKSIVDYINGLFEKTNINLCNSFALVSTLATDLGNTVIYASLASGGALHLFTKNSVSDIEYMHNYFLEHNIQCLKIVPSHWKALYYENKMLLPEKLIIFGGEALSGMTVENIKTFGNGCTIVNHYGPTETTIGKLLYVVQPDVKYVDNVPIGKPFSNTKVLILTNNLKLCPIGVPGELHITGDGLARGYLNNPGLTKEKFIRNPFSKREESVMYKTGDQVKYLSDGNILFLGRIDNQIKIRGYRIEPGEIENTLHQCDKVSQAVVLPMEDKQGNKRLVGYIIPKDGKFYREEIVMFLRNKLPDYMVPTILVEMESFPLTLNGKIDRNSFPDTDEMGLLRNEYVSPRNEVEIKLVQIWQDVLEIDKIGINDNFFELGGHSLLAVRLVSAIRKVFTIEMPIVDIFDYPKICLLSGKIYTSKEKFLVPVITKAKFLPVYPPLSFSQERIWFIDQLAGSVEYHVPYVWNLSGNLDKKALAFALENCVKRHEILRTLYLIHDGEPYQYVRNAEDFHIIEVDGAVFSAQQLKAFIQNQVNIPFNLSEDYMLRAVLIYLKDNEHILLIVLHHIASDGWSRSILINDFGELYNLYLQGRASDLEVLKLQYMDYAVWQRNYLKGDILDKKLKYWQLQLKNVSKLQLFTDFYRPAIQSSIGANSIFHIDKKLTASLELLSQQQGVTLFMTLLSAFKILLYRYTNQKDICVGTPVAGRQQIEIEGLIGFFINTIALRTQIMGDLPFVSFLQQVRNVTLAGYENQDVPFEKVVELVEKQRDLSSSPIFQVMFVLQNTPDAKIVNLPGLQLSGEVLEFNHSKFDLSFYVTETNNGLSCTVEYCTALYTEATIRLLINHYKALLIAITASPHQNIGLLPMWGTQTQDRLIKILSGNNAIYPLDKNLADLFTEQVLKTPDKTALIFENDTVSYRQLNERSNQLANYLTGKGIMAGSFVPLCMDRSADMVTGILGIIKAGAVYVPIEPDYPIERIWFILKDVRAEILIVNSNGEKSFFTDGKFAKNITENVLIQNSGQSPDGTIIEIINLNDHQVVCQPLNKLQTSVQNTSVACVIYTSGSSGQPKGVVLNHAGIVNRLYWMWETYPFTEDEVNAVKTSIGFVDHIWELFGALNKGIVSVIISKAVVLDLDAFINLLQAEKVTRLVLVPSLLRTLLNKLYEDKINLFYLLYWTSSGDFLPVSLVLEFYKIFPAGTHKLFNIYGSTEVTADVCCYDTSENYRLGIDEYQYVPIGKPIANTNLYLIDQYNQLIAENFIGEICVAGIQVSPGYLNLPELTKDRFVSARFNGGTNTLIFKTGDYGRLLTNGNIEFLGRLDNQVKIRGSRLELNEVEAAMYELNMIKDCVIVSKFDAQGDNVLVAYVVGDNIIDKQRLSDKLGMKLPGFMIPQVWVQLPALPLTPTGKIDRKALPEISLQEISLSEYNAPVTEMEKKLQGIWQQLLNKEPIGINNNFFELGGHSLMAMRLVSSIRKQLKVELSIRDLFLHPTIVLLANYIDNRTSAAILIGIDIQIKPEKLPLSYSQERLWFIDCLEGSTQYHLPLVIKLKGKLNFEAITYSLKSLLKRQEVLRSVILEEDGVAYQKNLDWNLWKLETINAVGFDEQKVEDIILKSIKAPFNLSTDYMLRALLVEISDHENILVITVHHIASDGWSGSIIVKEITEFYDAFNENRKPVVSILPVQYSDFAIWQRKFLKESQLDEKLIYWKNKLADIIPLQLHTDFPRPLVQSIKGATTGVKLSKELSDQLKLLSLTQGVTLFMTVTAAVKILLFRYSGQEDITIGTPVAGRPYAEVENLVGLFINTIVLRTELKHGDSFSKLLQQVRVNTLEAFDHQEIPFEKVVEVVTKERDLSRSPLFQVMVMLQNKSDAIEFNLGEVQLSRLNLNSKAYDTAKFDLTFNFIETAEGLYANVEYCTDLFYEETINRMLGHLNQLLNVLVRNPEECIGLAPILLPAELDQVLKEFNPINVNHLEPATVVSLFEQQVLKHPNAIATIFLEEELTYRDLNSKANRLAHYLLAKGVNKEALVPLFLDNSLEMFIGILGVLKSGAAYVPIDPGFPSERVIFVLEDTKAFTIITNKKNRLKLPQLKAIDILELDSDFPLLNKYPDANLSQVIDFQQLAYVIYTSGSTGKPKGVMIQHSNLVQYLVNNKSEYIDVEKNSSGSYIHMSFTFDASLTAIFMPLISGKSVVISSKHLLDAFEDENLLKYAPYDFIKITPAHLELILPSFLMLPQKNLAQKLIIGGEALQWAHLNSFREEGINSTVINEYGPTETTVGCTTCAFNLSAVGENITKSISIGKPMQNVLVYIVDKAGQLVPVGVNGEIWIGGSQVGRGYLNLPGLSEQKFIDDPFSNNSGARLYKSGDIGCWLADGSIEFLGRIDEQVKIGGHRIELGEIENCLMQSGLVKQVIVIVREDMPGIKKLVGYVVSAGMFKKNAIISFLEDRLPLFMIPNVWVNMEKLPLTLNGKIDRKSLPVPYNDSALLKINEWVSPRNEMESQLLNIWKELLQVQNIDVHDNFFELGGDSILTIQVVSRARRLGLNFHPKDIFLHQTIARLARAVSHSPIIEKGEQGILAGESGLLPVQQWYLEMNQPAVSYYNQAVLLNVDKELQPFEVNQAIIGLIDHHDALRFRYYQLQNVWKQEYVNYQYDIAIENFTGISAENISSAISEISSRYQETLDIQKGKLIKVVFIQTPFFETANRLLVVIHHLVIDGVSWRILFEDIDQMFSHIKKGEPFVLGHKSNSYRQWFNNLKNWGVTDEVKAQLSYWENIKRNYQELKADHTFQMSVKITDFDQCSVKLNADQTSGLLKDVPKVYHTEINDILLSALAKTLSNWTGNARVTIGLEGHGRYNTNIEMDIARTIGWFTSLYPLLINVPEVLTSANLIRSVKEQLRQIPGKGLGYGVLKYINNESALQGSNPWDIVFNYLGQFDNVLRESIWISAAVESPGQSRSPLQTGEEKLSVNSFITEGELVLSWSYSKKHYEYDTIKKLAETFITNLGALIDHCTQQKITFHTPSDFGLGNHINYLELDSFLAKDVNEKVRNEVIETMYHLSGLQKGILFHSLYESGFGTYIHQFVCDLEEIDLDVFRQSWGKIMESHSILRSAFYYNDFSVPVQCVYKNVQIPVQFIDLRFSSRQEQVEAIEEYESDDRLKTFDLSTAPLMRLALLQLDDNNYHMIWTWHHILFDGWSMPILMEEFLTTYEALAGNSAIVNIEEDRFEDYIKYLNQIDKQTEKTYWSNYLQKIEQSTLLPFIEITNERNKGAGEYKTSSLNLDKNLTTKIQAFAQTNHLTLNTVMQGVWALLLSGYTGNQNVVFGVIVSGRPDDLPEIEKRVGLYINAVPFCTAMDSNIDVVTWLQQIQMEQVEARQYQYTPLTDIQAWSEIPGDLFDNLLVFDNYPVSKIISSRKWKLQVKNAGLHEQNNYPLSIVIVSNPDQITIQFLYNTFLIRQEYADNLKLHFENVLTQIVSGQVNTIGDINIITKGEETKLLHEFNKPSKSNIYNKTVVDLFQEQVVKTPGAIAFIFKDQTISYLQLNNRANKIAQFLKAKGVREETLVPVCMNKSLYMYVSILAILKSGGAFVPIDPEYPAERISYIMEDTKASVVLTTFDLRHKFENIPAIEIMNFDDENTVFDEAMVVEQATNILPRHLAYVIYTSGSTGKPKGVMIEHTNLSHYLLNEKTQYLNDGFGSGSFIHLNYCFDASLTAFFMPLICGKSSVIGSMQSAAVFEDPNLWKYAPYDFIKITPSHLEFLQPVIKNEDGDLLTQNLVIGGEALNLGHLKYLFQDQLNINIINEYGPTEATVGCSVYALNTKVDYSGFNKNIPIGKPIENIELFILNEEHGLLPVGVVGQIYIGGGGLARGYLNLPELSKEKFITNPFAETSGELMYKTGDLGRWLPDGNIEYCGRIDEQLKINGYRVELGEIESALASINGVNNSKVIVKENKTTKALKLNAYLQIDSEKLPLLSNYLGLLIKNQVKPADLHILPSGIPVLSSNLNEVRFLYNEIFEDHCYLKHGITLNQDSCVVDIGANVGFFTVYLNVLSKNIKIYSIEPIPEVHRYLVANRELYAIKGKALQLAVSDKEGEVDFTWYPQVSIVSGMSDEISQVTKVVKSYIENSKKEDFETEEIDSMLQVKLETRQIRCKTKTLSQIISEEKIEKIDLLKIDVENSEHLVMNGILNEDWDKIGSVIIEVHDVNGRLESIRQTLVQKGFNTYVEKEKMLAKDDVLYNLFAIKPAQSGKLDTLGDNESLRKTEWQDEKAFIAGVGTRLKDKLPAYMLPSNIVLMNAFPLNGNGKVDKNAFPDVDESGKIDDAYKAPQNELEEQLVQIWKRVLDVDTVGIHDDFFDLGGDSLLSIRLISSIRKELNMEIAISTFFDLVTIEKVANYLKVNQPDFSVELENYEEIKL